MKYFDSLRKLAAAVCIGIAGIANAQTSHPVSYPMDAVSPATYLFANNFYKNYVGLRFQVSSPLTIAGDKVFTAAYDITNPTSTGNWGGAPYDMVDSPVKFGPVGDTAGCTPYPAGYFAGKIAIVWRGNCEFGAKALAAQTAGAVAVVIVNHLPGGPVGMAAGASGASVTIPVYMISNDDGSAITSVLNWGGTAKMNIVINWGVGHHNDMGFVPGGYSTTANFAMPYTQLASHAAPYKGINGAFIANYGLHNATNVKLHSDLMFTPTGGSSSNVYSDSVTLGSFPVADSIYTFYGPLYDIPGTSGAGRYDLKYTITSDSTDEFMGDNTHTHTFYTTDTIWSKGRYDFAAHKPVSPIYRGPGGTDPYIWGVPYYIANGGSVIKTVQFSVSNGPGTLPGGQQMNVYVFKVHDTLGGTPDMLFTNSELELVGLGSKTFDGSLDSSFQTFTVGIGDTINGNSSVQQVFLDANSWYVIAPEVPITGTSPWALGMDGFVNGYPRAYGLSHFHSTFEPYNPIWFGDRYLSTTNMVSNPDVLWNPIAFPGIANYLGVDSVVYDNQKDILPAVAFTSSTHISAVNNNVKPFANINLYPNPCTDQINVSVKMDAAEKLTYTVITATGKFVSREIHQGVKEEVYNYNTANLAPGNYYFIVSGGDNKFTSKKFTVIK